MSRLIAGLLIVLATVATNTSASAEVYSCRIGKPSYCFKYGGHLCEMWNNAPNKPAACAKWTSACVDCHNDIPTCLGHTRPLGNTPQCKRCDAKWLSCMKKIDRRFWPNRQTRNAG